MTKAKEKDMFMKAKSILSARAKEPGFWREMWQQARLVYYLVRDPDVPFYLKLLPFAALGYLLLPFDILTDLAPVIGQLDDITAILVFSKVFIELAPPEVVARHMAMIRERDGFAAADGAQDGATAIDDDVAKAIVIDAEHEIVGHEVVGHEVVGHEVVGKDRAQS